MNKKKSAPKPASYNPNHNWMFDQTIRSPSGGRDSLLLTLDSIKIKQVNTTSVELISTHLTSPQGDPRDVDAMLRAEPATRQSTIKKMTFRVLHEHKSDIKLGNLLMQLAEYQCGAYTMDSSPIVPIVVNNGRPWMRGGEICDQIQYRDYMSDMDASFWEAFDSEVMNFSAIVLNLRDPKIQHRIRDLKLPTSIGWYAMAKVHETIDEIVGAEMLKIAHETNAGGAEGIWLAVMDYLKNYHPHLTIQWWVELENKLNGGSNVMSLSMGPLEYREHIAREQGLEQGLEQGRKQGLEQASRKIAERLLGEGIDAGKISRLTDLSVNQIEIISNR